jgi:cadmium resistance protein CadD (predicted permease)
MNDTKNRPSSAFWIIAVLGLAWYMIGVRAYIDQAYMTAEELATRPEAEQLFYLNLPAWVTAAYAISVFVGAFACIALLMRKKWALSLFVVSLLAVLAQFVHNVFIQDYMEVTPQRMIFSLVIVLIGAFLIWYSKRAASRGWLT